MHSDFHIDPRETRFRVWCSRVCTSGSWLAQCAQAVSLSGKMFVPDRYISSLTVSPRPGGAARPRHAARAGEGVLYEGRRERADRGPGPGPSLWAVQPAATHDTVPA